MGASRSIVRARRLLHRDRFGNPPRSLNRIAAALLVLTTSRGAAQADSVAGGARERLARIRTNPALASDRREIDALVRESEALAPGPERLEARMLAAEAYLGRLHSPDAGRALLRDVATDPTADDLTAAQATNTLVRSELDGDLVDAARADAARLRDHVGPTLSKLVAARVRRRLAHRGAVAVLAAFAVATGVGVARKGGWGASWRAVRELAPLALGFGAFVAIAGGGLAAAFTSGTGTPFVAFGAAAVPVVLGARAWAAVGSPSGAARCARAGASALAVAATALLVLEAVDASFLAGFGL